MAGDAKPDTSFNLSRWAIEHPSITRFLFGIMIIAGVLGLMRIGQKEDPDFTFRVMVVQAVWPGASLDDMQDQVVNKIERKLQETPHLDFVRSFTRAGSAIITVQIKGDTNPARRDRRLLPGAQEGRRYRQRTAAAAARALLQRRVRRHLHHPACDQRRRLFSYPELKKFAIAGARHAVARSPGVEKAVIIGDQPEKIYIDVSSKVLAERGIWRSTICRTRSPARTMSIPPARSTPARVRCASRSAAISPRPEDIRELRLKLGGQVTRLGDIATVTSRPRGPLSAASIASTAKDASSSASSWRKGFNVTDVGKDVADDL